MSTSKRVVKNTVFLYLRTLVSLLLSVFTTRVLLQGLGESDFGLYNVVGGVISMLGFLSASLSSATQRYLNYAEGAGRTEDTVKYFNNALIIHWALALLMLIIFAIAALAFFNGILNIPEGKKTDAIAIYGCMIISTIFSITTVPYEAEINAHENMLFFSILGIGDVIIKFLIALAVLYLAADKLIFYAILMAAESFLLRFISKAYCKRNYTECRNTNMRKYYNKSIIKEMTSFAGWNLTNITTSVISLYGMSVIINHYFGTDMNAAMGIATQLTGVMMGLSMNMIKAVSPVIMKSESGNKHSQMLKYTMESCKFSYLIFSICCIPVFIFIDPILRLWLTIVPVGTSQFCIALIFSILTEQFTVVLYQSIMATGDIKNYNIVRSISNIIPIFVSVAMFQYGDFKPYWVIINRAISISIIGGIINLYFSKIKLGFSLSVFFKDVVSKCLAGTTICLVMTYVLSFITSHWIMLFFISAIASLPIYWSVALNKDERNSIIIMLQSVKRRISHQQ